MSEESYQTLGMLLDAFCNVREHYHTTSARDDFEQGKFGFLDHETGTFHHVTRDTVKAARYTFACGGDEEVLSRLGMTREECLREFRSPKGRETLFQRIPVAVHPSS